LVGFLIFIFILVSSSLAQEAEKKGFITFGYSQSQGNIDVATASLTANYVVKYPTYRLFFDLKVLYGTAQGQKNAEQIDGKLRYELRRGRYFPFWDLIYYRNPFQNFEHRIATGPGIGYYITRGKKKYLSVSYYLYYYYDVIKELSTTIEDRTLFHNIEERFRYKFTRTLTFKEKGLYSVSDENFQNYYINIELNLINKITKKLGLQISYYINYQNIPKEDQIKRLDTTLTTSIMYNF